MPTASDDTACYVVAVGAPRDWMPVALAAPGPAFPARVVGVSDWAAARLLAAAADGVVVCAAAGDVGPLLADVHPLRRLLAVAPCVPLVVRFSTASGRPGLTDTRGNATEAATHGLLRRALGPRAVVGTFPRPALLWGALQRAAARATLADAAAAIAASGLHPHLRRALVRACAGWPPLTSVAACAAAAGCHRRTFWRVWRAAGPLGAAADAEHLLGWLLILHACARHAPAHPWERVSAAMGVDRTTLCRVAQRTVAAPLSELTPDRQRALRAAFNARVLSPLLGQPAPDSAAPSSWRDGRAHVGPAN